VTVLRAIAFTGVAWALSAGATWVVVVTLGEGAR
jgi:threonine/homoserine efflux transporter RhtA